MIIRTNDRDVKIIAVYDDIVMQGKYTFPALRFEFEAGVSDEEINAILSGSFQILNDNGEVLGSHEGYTTLNKVAVIAAKITSAEQQIVELTSSLETSEAKNATYQEEIQSLEAENAELLFNTLTSSNI